MRALFTIAAFDAALMLARVTEVVLRVIPGYSGILWYWASRRPEDLCNTLAFAAVYVTLHRRLGLLGYTALAAIACVCASLAFVVTLCLPTTPMGNAGAFLLPGLSSSFSIIVYLALRQRASAAAQQAG